MSDVKLKTTLMQEALEPLLHSDSTLTLRGKGMIMGLDIGNSERAAAIVQECFKNGLIVASCGVGGQVIKLIPPLTIANAHLTEGLNILIQATRNTMEEAA